VYPKRIGSVSDIDPANGIYGSMSAAEQAQQQQKHQQYYQQVQMMQQQEHPPQQQQMRQQPSYSSLQEKQSRQSTALVSKASPKAIFLIVIPICKPFFSASTGRGSNIGKIADYDPLTDGPRVVPNAGRSSTTLVYSSEPRGIQGGKFAGPG